MLWLSESGGTILPPDSQPKADRQLTAKFNIYQCSLGSSRSCAQPGKAAVPSLESCRACFSASAVLCVNSTAGSVTVGAVWLHPVHIHCNVANRAVIDVRSGGVGEEEKGSSPKCSGALGGMPCSCTLAVLEAVEIALELRELFSPGQKTQRMPPTAPGTTSSSVGMGTASPTSGSVMERTTAGTGQMRRSARVRVPDAAPRLHPNILHQLWGSKIPPRMGCVHALTHLYLLPV